MKVASVMTRRASTLVALPLALSFAACKDKRTMQSRNEISAEAAASRVMTPSADYSARGVALSRVSKMERRQAMDSVFAAPPPVTPRSSAAPAVTSSMVIRNGDVAIKVDSLAPAIDAVKKLATSLGGYIGNVSVSAGEQQIRSAQMELKIPAARYDDAILGLTPIGKLERSTSTVEDVGEEFVDITARIANAKRLEARLVDILATRAGRLQDVLAVERELARVREEIERYEGRVRYLSSRIAMSTIVATIHEPAPLIASDPGTNPMREAFVNMWRNFVRFVAASIELSGVLVPLAVLVALGLWGWRRVRRPRIPAAA